jgi:hypothetical protein
MAKGPLPLYPNEPPARKSGSTSSAGLMAFGLKRLITTLALIALLLGIVAEGISIVTGYYNMKKTSSEAISARYKALSEGCDVLDPPPGGCPR